MILVERVSEESRRKSSPIGYGTIVASRSAPSPAGRRTRTASLLCSSPCGWPGPPC